MWRTFESNSGDQLWLQAMESLRSAPDIIGQAGRGGPTREILHATFALSDPQQRWVSSRRPALNPAFALAEIIWIMRGRRDAEFLSYFNRSLAKFAGGAANLHGAYGFRLRKHFGVDQLEQAFETLRANPTSRQVVMQLWDLKVDSPEKSGHPRDADIPCNTQCFLKVRNGRLEWTQLMRSNDVHLGLPHNLVQFTALQEIMAGWLGLDLGSYHHLSDSLHIYEHDLELIASEERSAPNSTLALGLPKAESDRTFAFLERAVEMIISPETDVGVLAANLETDSITSSYRDILTILTAEGLRRRKAVEVAERCASTCKDSSLRFLWHNWMQRVRENALRK
jgi:thymidylate synthase